ncbi:hypothetical protein SLEP1_g46281 [Rubroshorea leprosula]|uniref:AAA+ ATPase domain-containing protein n=1 Tax=Rubroshorea leprosula TaxID=152421 RepID=A0AAV5LLV8_9ROSI|nr:hypothetical protein SLEP1_g46281 [Rubroshorea leprosula]
MAIGPKVWKYVEYQIYHNYYVSEFQNMQKDLKNRQDVIEANLNTQLKKARKTTNREVEAWLEKVHQETDEKVVEDLICKGGCFTYICSSRRLDKRTQALKEGIFKQGEKYTIAGESLVVDVHSKGVPQLAEKCIARDDVQEEILQLLRGDEVTRIAVCGMGGVGKTTIMKQVYNQLLKEPKFNKVIWVKVSKDFDIIVQQKKQFDVLKFQKSIARKLGIELENEDQDTIDELAELISQKLQQGSYVLILDDVWEPFSPENVGIPDLLGNNGCKLVLTTRIQQKVARAMECEVILVKPLSDDEASRLFLDKVGRALLSNPKFKSDIEPFFNQILKKCNGLPLAIGTVAKTMKGKFDRYSWEMADKELSNSEEIFGCLKFSYDHLEELCKNCFLYCALYPEDFEIPKEELIEFLIEEGFIEDGRGSRHLMNSEGHVILGKLIDNCMLELVKQDKKEDCVSMHDLLRDMALNISPRFMVKAGMALEELPEEHEWKEDLLKVSLMNNNIREIPSSMLSPKCPMLTTLLLSNIKITTIPEAFFDQMLGLKILDLCTNYKLGRLPSSVSKLENLTTLLLEDCKSLKEVPSLSNLGGLKKLDLLGTSIEELPQGLNMLTNLKYLHLGGKLSEIPDGLLQNLSDLQHLGVYWSIPLKGEEIGKLRKLEFLHGWFSTVDDMSRFVNSKRKLLNGYCFYVGGYTEVEKVHRMLASFPISAKCILYNDIDICGEVSCLPFDAQGFYILDCKDVRILDDISGFQNVTDLRGCVVDKCDGLEFVVSLCCLKPFRNIELLSLYHLPNLNAVFEKVETIAMPAPLPAGTFSLLRKINVVGCGKMKKLLPLGLSLYLQNLQIIKVKKCDQMEEVIWSEDGEGEKAPKKLTLPKLERLVLHDLPALKSICSGFSTVLSCDSIKRIDIRDCGKIESAFWSGFNPLPTLEHLQLWRLENLKSVFDEEALGSSAPSTTFFSLKTIDVYNCPKLRKVFSLGWLLRCFQSLETIKVNDCNQMEELFSSLTYEEIETLEKITLPNLQSLELKKLPELKSICSSSSVLICDSIRILKISDCEKLKRIPLHLSSLDNGQPPSLKQVQVYPKDCWESLEWDQSNAKDVLRPFVSFSGMS